MDNRLAIEVINVLVPLLLCSVSDRYQKLYQTEIGKELIGSFNLEGAAFEVASNIVSSVSRRGKLDKFAVEVKAIPVPEWYEGN